MVLLFSVIGIALLLFFLMKSIKVGKEYLTIINVIALLMIVDIFIPAIIGSLTGEYFSLNYVIPIKEKEAMWAVIIADFSVLFLISGYSIVKNRTNKNFVTIINEKRLSLLFYFSILVFILDITYKIQAAGGLDNFILFRMRRVYDETLDLSGSGSSVINIISEFIQTLRLMIVSIMLSHKELFQRRKIYLFIIITFVFSIFTFYRGAIIIVFLCIASTIELCTNGLNKSGNLSKTIKQIVLAGVLAFVVFGGVRSILQNNTLDESKGSEKTEFLSSVMNSVRQSTGASLIAIVRSIRYINSGKKLFNGASYTDMFLSFVPRSIMPNKPSMYGTQNLTMAQGSPSSTMDAISLQGELLMNFGYIGLAMMFLWGIIFHILDNFRKAPIMKYYYSATFFVIASTSSWMGFTGFFAQTKYLIICYILIRLCIKAKRQVE